jgi:hypothetical protein
MATAVRTFAGVVAAFGAILLAACGSSASTDTGGSGTDAAGSGSDAGPSDSGLFDSGLFGTPCGDASCMSTEFCRANPNGPCTPNDGGVCDPSMEACSKAGVAGCTVPETRTCGPLPAMCATSPSCACLINTNPCPDTVHADCRKQEGQGVTVSCPFP